MSEFEKWRENAVLDDAISHGLTEAEFKNVCESLGREISILELGICAALYSEHCSYKSTRVHLKTLPVEGERVLQGPGENAGVVDIGDGQAVVFKVESHNHPTFIEPFQGAATGVGGILRDVFTMGARPLALMNGLRFGSLANPRTAYLVRRAVAGIGAYGNSVGVPTVGGELFFHKAYDGNCLVNAFALGLVDHDKVFLGTASGVGNPIFYVGSKTGRDGIHGATMASEEFNADSAAKLPTVQVGDPFQEKLLLEACLEVMQTGAVVGIQDMGAAGMTSSTYEMADRAGTGVRINLEQVPQREENMNPYEIMLSESQERMLLVVKAGREQEVIDIFSHWDLDAVKIGEVIEGTEVELCWNSELVSSIPVSVLTSSVPKYRWEEATPYDFEERSTCIAELGSSPAELSGSWLNLLSSVNLCSRQEVYQQYDSTVRTNTVIHPGGDAAVIRIKSDAREKKGEAEKGIAMTLDCNSRYCAIDPRQGAALSVLESCRNITAVGATPIGISDCLNYGSPEKPESMWQIAEGIRGIGESARAMGIPVVSGNVSLYNETQGMPILPTPMIAMVGLIDDASKCVGIHFDMVGDVVLLIGRNRANELGGSEYLAQERQIEKGCLPLVDYDNEIAVAELVRTLIDKRLLKSCHDVSSGGLAVALAESCFRTEGPVGAKLTRTEGSVSGEKKHDVMPEDLLFSESGARYLISADPQSVSKIKALAEQAGIEISFSGAVGGDRIEIENCAAISIEEAYRSWKQGLNELFYQESLTLEASI